MAQTRKEIKARHFKKVYDNAEIVECKCGCGSKMKNKDKYGRDKIFVNGHNKRTHEMGYDQRAAWRAKPDNKQKLRIARSLYVRDRRHKLLVKAGAKCGDCGLEYKWELDNAPVFDLHHRNPETKLFNLNAQTMRDVNWKAILDEFDKCDLVCSNCHRMRHRRLTRRAQGRD